MGKFKFKKLRQKRKGFRFLLTVKDFSSNLLFLILVFQKMKLKPVRFLSNRIKIENCLKIIQACRNTFQEFNIIFIKNLILLLKSPKSLQIFAYHSSRGNHSKEDLFLSILGSLIRIPFNQTNFVDNFLILFF